jgi:hypothetical protein
MVLLNGPPLSNFVDRGLWEWEWLGPGSTKISAHGPPKWYFWMALCYTQPITLCNTPKNLPTLVLAPSLFPHSLNYYPPFFSSPPFLSSVPLSHTLTVFNLYDNSILNILH